MKTEFEAHEIEAIALKVAEMLKPLINGNGKTQEEDVIFDVRGLSEYLKVSYKWIYERTHLKEIPYIKTGGILRFRKKDIDKWFDTFKIPPVSKHCGMLKVVNKR